MIPRLALDQNFPTPIVKALQGSIVEVELRHVYEIDARLSRLDDWELLLALRHHADGYAGLVTTDARMLAQPRELAALNQTRLSLVVAEAAGHDPVRATGLVLTHLPRISGLIDPERAQIWTLTAHTPTPKTPWDHLGRIASKQKRSTSELFGEAKLDERTLAGDPLNRGRSARR